jgi:hypothetical protein
MRIGDNLFRNCPCTNAQSPIESSGRDNDFDIHQHQPTLRLITFSHDQRIRFCPQWIAPAARTAFPTKPLPAHDVDTQSANPNED